MIQKRIDQQYYKPHYGPEETQDMVSDNLKKMAETKNNLKADLEAQIMEKKLFKMKKFMEERGGDQQNLEVAHNVYVAEERAIQAKNYKQK